MKKSLFSLLGMTLLIGSVWAANGDLDISDLFDWETPRIPDAYQRLLNDYDNGRWYSTSPQVGCMDVNEIRVSSEPVEDLFLVDASQYILFISPYSMDRIKRWDSSIDYSKIIMKRKIIGNIPEGRALDAISFNIFSDEIDSKQKYYWFIVPVDSYDGVWRPSSEFELNMSECFWTISISNPDNPSEWITIMDRNLWAKTNDITNSNSYGKYFQWWNNYWFNPNYTIATTRNFVDWKEEYNNRGYFWEEFVMPDGCATDENGNDYCYQSSDYWSGENHDWLWGWADDDSDNNWWEKETNYEDRQWPCPDWYHVPSAWEWWLLVKYWQKTYGNSTILNWWNGQYGFVSNEARQEFMNYFKLPLAWAIDSRDASMRMLGDEGMYWSSTAGSANDGYANHLIIYSDNNPTSVFATAESPRIEGYSVRCFKNTYESEVKSTKITLKPWLNTFSTPAVLKSISFSNGWENISFAKMGNGKWKALAINGGTFDKVIRPLEWFIIRNSNSEDVTMTIEYDTDIDINDALHQKQLDAWRNFLGITKTNNPFGSIANAVAMDIIDFTAWNSNKIDLSKLRDATSFMLWKAYWVFVNNSNWIYGWRNNPDVLPNATLVNNLTKVVKFPVNEVSKKIVFDGTYTALADHSIIWFNIEHSNVDLENCHNDISYNDIDFNLYVNWELVGSNLNPSSNDIILNSCQYFWSLHFNGIINVKKWDSLQIKIEWELNSLAYWDTDKESSYLYKLSFFGVGWNEDILASANLAPVKIVDDSNELSVQAMSGKNTVLLNEPNAVLWRFMVMPTNSTQWYFDNLVLKVTNPAWSTLDYDDIELRIDWTEVDEWDWQSSDWRLWYEDLDKLVDSLWSEVEVSIKNPDDWDYVLDIIDINTVWTSHFGKDPIITFNKRFESALVYIESQRNEDDQTHYILWVDKYDDSDVIPSLRLFTWYDVEQNECVGSLSFDKLSWESFYFEDWDEIVINNGNDAQLIKCIEYIVAYDGQECVDLDENNNCNKYMPVMQIRSRVSINKDDYLDYFKIRTWGFRKVFGRDSVGNGVCWDWVIDAWENCSNCPVDLGDICNTNCNSVDDLQFSHSIDKNGLITLNWTPNRQVYIEVKDSSEADWDYGSDHWISEDKVNSPFVFDAWWHPNYYKFFAYDNYQQCDHYKRYVVDATNVCSWVDNLDIQHQIQNGKIILSWDSDVNLSIATVAPPLTLEMLESGQVTTTSETVENGTFSYDIDGSGDYIFILENNFWCDNERYYTVHVD